VVLLAVLTVLLVPSEAWAAPESFTSSGGNTVYGTVPTNGAGDPTTGKVAITWTRVASSTAHRVCTVALNGDVWSGSIGSSSAGSNYTYTVPSGTSSVNGANPVVAWKVWVNHGTTSSWSCPADGGTREASEANLAAFAAPAPYELIGRNLTAVPSSCPDTFTNTYAYADGSYLGVRFQWSGAKPVGGWRVESEDQVTYYGKVPRAVLSGTLSTQGADFASANVPSYLRVESAADGTCYVNIATGVKTDPTLVDDGSNECSFGDVACYFRAALSWAFVPQGESLDQFDALGDDFGNTIPFVWIEGTAELVGFNLAEYGAGWSYDGIARFPCDFTSIQVCEGTYMFVLPPSDPIVTWMRDHRDDISAFMWILLLAPMVLWFWRQLLPITGSGSQ
jgi:hypothetical protein